MNQDINQFDGGNVFQMPQKNENKPLWAALTCFILSLANIFMCCCCTYIMTPASLVLGTVSLAKKWRGKGFAVTGIIISVVTVVFMVASNIMFGEESEDLMKIYMEPDKYISMYEETGEVPEEFIKYTDEKYDKYWKAMGYEDFEEFYGDFIISTFARFYSGSLMNGYQSSGGSQGSSGYYELPDHYGEEPVNI